MIGVFMILEGLICILKTFYPRKYLSCFPNPLVFYLNY